MRNTEALPAPRTQSRTSASTAFDGVREAAGAAQAAGKEVRFTALPHHITPQLLRDGFMQLMRNAAAGVDGVRWGDGTRFSDAEEPQIHAPCAAAESRDKVSAPIRFRRRIATGYLDAPGAVAGRDLWAVAPAPTAGGGSK